MKQVLIRQGQAVVEEVPSPQVESGTILVRVSHSCISVGTEISGIKTTGMPLWKRALKQPENVKKVINSVTTLGLSKTRSLVNGKLAAGNPTGYSAAGVVLEVGTGINDICPGDRVACAGAQCAHHAEIIRVPRNLAVPIPDGLDYSSSSTVTLGSIALQGIRRARPTLGETFVVIGLGILGQLTAQMLKINGCRVIGTDLDKSRIKMAEKLGMDVGVPPEENDIDHVMRLTGGIGADGVIITAATPSDSIVSTAFKMCRKKGRVILVGDVGLNLKRADFYQKELDFYISSSYGPGRYDSNYEEKGIDYPVAYVRWTENRNMAAYLRMLAEGKVKVDALITSVFPVEEAHVAYEKLKADDDKPLMALLSYPCDPDKGTEYLYVVPNPSALPSNNIGNKIRVGLIGAGGFAKGMHLPNLQKLSKLFHLQAVMSKTGHNALATAKQFGANYACTDYQHVLDDPEVDAVIIATRHNLHASMVIEAIKAGKHVLVEKPLALASEELNSIVSFYSASEEGKYPLLLTGFNRRFSRFIRPIYDQVKYRINPMIINYRMNAGYIPLDHWVHSEEGGGRNRGEACHIYDIFTYLTGSRAVLVDAKSINSATGYYGSSDNFVATIKFEDGSVATLTYTALGSKDYPKEQMEVFVDGKIFVLNDYKKLSAWGTKIKGLESSLPDKGQKEELEAFAQCIMHDGDWPIPLWQQVQSTKIAFEVEKKL